MSKKNAKCEERNTFGQRCVRSQSPHRLHWPAGASGQTWVKNQYGRYVSQKPPSDHEFNEVRSRLVGIDEAERVFDEMWSSPNWDGEIPVHFAKAYSEALEQLREKLTKTRE